MFYYIIIMINIFFECSLEMFRVFGFILQEEVRGLFLWYCFLDKVIVGYVRESKYRYILIQFVILYYYKDLSSMVLF